MPITDRASPLSRASNTPGGLISLVLSRDCASRQSYLEAICLLHAMQTWRLQPDSKNGTVTQSPEQQPFSIGSTWRLGSWGTCKRLPAAEWNKISVGLRPRADRGHAKVILPREGSERTIEVMSIIVSPGGCENVE